MTSNALHLGPATNLLTNAGEIARGIPVRKGSHIGLPSDITGRRREDGGTMSVGTR